MTFQAVDSARALLRQGFRAFARSVTYTPHGGSEQTIQASTTGKAVVELFGAAQQQDLVGTVDATEFRATFGATATPRKFDRLQTAGLTYTVQEWRGAPHDSAPVFFRLLLRGGQQ